MTAATTLAGVAQMNLSTLAPENPNDPFVAAFPTFGKVITTGQTTTRDVVALLRRSAASAPTARQLGVGGLEVSDPPDVPAVFRALNPLPSGGSHAFPTFVFGRSGLRRFMNVVTLRSGFTVLRVPLTAAGFGDMTNAEAVFAGAHLAAIAQGFVTGLPTFQVEPATGRMAAFAVVLAFDDHAAALSPPQTGGPGGGGPTVPSRAWTLTSLAAANEGGLALITTGPASAPVPVLFNGFDGSVVQFRPTVPDLVPVDPTPAGTRSATSGVPSQISASTNGNSIDLLWAGPALFHASRPVGSPASFVTETISGVTSPAPTGYVGHFNQILRASSGVLHAFAFLSSPPGVDASILPVDQSTCFNLVHFTRATTGWVPAIVDGDRTTDGHLVTDMGQTMAAVFEPSGRMHVFYPSGTTSTIGQRLRHAEFDGTRWIAETLDGAGGGTSPGGPGTGRISAAVGLAPTAVSFDGALWVFYQDATNGNLRSAHGVRDAQGVLQWDFRLLDGNARRGSTRGRVQSAAAVVWGDVLSVIYADTTDAVIRHAFRSVGETRWRYELLDGTGGNDGRVDAAVSAPIAVAAGGRDAAGRPDLPLFVTYLTDDPAQPGRRVRLATLA